METNRDYIFRCDPEQERPAVSFPVCPLPREQWRNGLIVRMPNHLGDAVMALPALLGLKKCLPESCALAVITPESLKPLYAALPEVDGVFPIQPHRAWGAELQKMIHQSRFGAGVLFNNSFRDAFQLKMAGIPRLFGAAARCRSFLLKRAFAFPCRKSAGTLGNDQLSQRYLAIAYALGAPRWDGKLPRFVLPIPPEERSREMAAWCSHPKLLVIAPGAAYGDAKRWPAEGFRAAARWWSDRGGAVAVTGAASEAAIAAEVLKGLPSERSVNFAGRTTLGDLMLLLHFARMALSNDSGTMHLGAALGTPGIAVFGSTDLTVTGPISSGWSLLYRKQPCSPCFRHSCPVGSAKCLRAITEADVIAELQDLCHKFRIVVE